MNKIIKTLILAAVFCLPAVGAFCVEFTFEMPVMPASPRIISVSNSSACEGVGSVFTVYADIQGAVQNEMCCNGVCQHECEPDCDFSACEATDFYGEPDPRIVPNPTCIPNTVDSSEGASTSTCQKSGITNPRLYYYYLDNPANMASTGMTYDATSGNFKADIPISAYSNGDSVTYFIAASDNRGNVVTQVPSNEDVPCMSSSVASWTSNLSTPAIDNCAASNSSEQCGKFKSGTPSCASANTVNDPTNDTCGSTGAIDTNGNQNKLDITGVSAGIGVGFSELSGQKVVCSKISLAANAPDIGDNSTPIGAFSMVYFNPDIIDPNPNDGYLPNAVAITYSPGISGVDPNLVKVLWDGECVTNPNTPDILACKLVTGGSYESRLKISSGDKSLLFIARDALPNGKNIVGTTSKSVTQTLYAGSMQLDGGTPFWLVDSAAGLTVVQKNQVTSIGCCPPIIPASPLVDEVQTCINGEGVSYSNGICGKAATQTTNTCRLTIKPSPDATIVNEYRIYRATTNSANDAVANGVLATISSNLTSTNIYDDVISVLDGKTYYYFFSSYNNMYSNETPNSYMSSSECTVADGPVPSEPPQNLSCSTPDGNEGKCYCSWDMDTVADPSIRKFRVTRDITELTDALPAAQGLTSYDYTDTSLVVGQSYTYYVSAIDAGNSESPVASAVCVPEDRKPPTKVSDFTVFNVNGVTTIDADVKWDGVADEDASYYNIYKCNNASIETSCATFPHANWIKANSSPITHTGAGAKHEVTLFDVSETGTKDYEGDYCYWIQACDNCVSTGTCEGTEPNCSGFDTLTSYRVCILITCVDCSMSRPATPQNVVATPLPEGGKCLLTWDRVTTDSDGYPFQNPDNPSDWQLDKYAVMSSVFGDGVPSYNPFVSNPVGTVDKALNPSFVHEGLTNGTTYQYYVIAYDSNRNFSDPQETIATCTPNITDPCAVSPTPSSCNITVAINGKFLEKKLEKCTSADPDCKTGVVKAVESPYAGATVRVVNNSTGYTVKEAFLESDGSVPALKLNAATEVSPGTDYKVVLHVPAGSYTGLYGLCENSAVAATEGCDIVISEPQPLSANSVVGGAAKTITQARLQAGESAADVFMGNGGEIGNANGDEYINLSDLAAMKTAFGNSAGSRCYRAWADFNLDGIVNLSDLAVLKQHFGETIPVADGETLSPTLTQSNAPFKGTADECCLSRTCN